LHLWHAGQAHTMAAVVQAASSHTLCCAMLGGATAQAAAPLNLGSALALEPAGCSGVRSNRKGLSRQLPPLLASLS
jgi:hypothetical protein